MNQKKRRRRRRKILLAGAGGAILAGSALLYSRKKSKSTNSNNSRSTTSSPVTVAKEQSLLPAAKEKLSVKDRQARGFDRLTKKQRSRLENKYGYNFQTKRFGKNVSKSSKRKGVKILRSLGRFKRHPGQLTSFDQIRTFPFLQSNLRSPQ